MHITYLALWDQHWGRAYSTGSKKYIVYTAMYGKVDRLLDNGKFCGVWKEKNQLYCTQVD